MKKLFTIILSITLLSGCDFYPENGTGIDGVIRKNGKAYKTIRKYEDKDDKSKKLENKKEVENDSTELHKLQNDPAEQEKFAREKSLIKKRK